MAKAQIKKKAAAPAQQQSKSKGKGKSQQRKEDEEEDEEEEDQSSEEEEEEEEGMEEEEGSEEEEEEEEEEGGGRDGMADMMARLLQQQVSGRVPVLAKRKTTIMKQLDGEKAAKDRLKEARRQKREDKAKFLVVPDHSTGDYERQLRKVATRGVVALFNAITKAKREEQENENNDDSKPVATKSKAAEVGALSRVNFVGLLQKEAASQQKRIANKTASAPLSEPATKTQEDSSEDDGDIDEEEDGDNAGVKRKSGWGALQEGLLVDKKLALKDWDKDEDDVDDDDESEEDIGKRPNPNSKLEDPFRELSEKVERAAASEKGKKKTGQKVKEKGKKRPVDDSSDDDDGDYKKKYPKKKASKRN